MKKLLSGVMLLAVILGFSSLGAVAKDYYSDMQPGHWAYKQIQILTDFGVVYGYPDGTYKPEIDVTRAEFSSMVIRALEQENAKIEDPKVYTDLPETHWAYGWVQRCVMFDLLRHETADKFDPNGKVSRAHAMSVMVNALTTASLSPERAEDIVSKKYSDYKDLPAWLLVSAGKAEVLGMIPDSPGHNGRLDADQPATRAELAAFIVAMLEQAKLNPNEKLKGVMAPRRALGQVIPEAKVNGLVATIPVGASIPIKIVSGGPMTSQDAQVGHKFEAKIAENVITRNEYLLIDRHCPVYGSVTYAKPGRCFFRDGQLDLTTTTVITPKNASGAALQGLCFKQFEVKSRFATWWERLVKGQRYNYENNDIVKVRLSKPMKIDLTNGWIIE